MDFDDIADRMVAPIPSMITDVREEVGCETNKIQTQEVTGPANGFIDTDSAPKPHAMEVDPFDTSSTSIEPHAGPRPASSTEVMNGKEAALFSNLVATKTSAKKMGKSKALKAANNKIIDNRVTKQKPTTSGTNFQRVTRASAAAGIEVRHVEGIGVGNSAVTNEEPGEPVGDGAEAEEPFVTEANTVEPPLISQSPRSLLAST
ncbi:uncharacterized protein BDZ99DRAFT_518073 [Mytilinidion resinicola]|uniref:Uncharacterized protein n=1 Tax=Mytilinidion resinicola TaxID=574789 RepID=A0A6A6YUJ9_9PEZI|nr:uncharacterized protein BDZ99DRAFT_518073 [Mytilinidion resinicola]KAF2812218.1 hypothetical protein BDZ99DRAFT_518073 [Mytilinidion resinicola]